MAGSVGKRFVDAVAGRDGPTLAALMHPDVDFRGLTPGRFWEARTPEEVLDVVLGHWFEEHDHIEAVAMTQGEPVSDTHQVGYRFEITNPDGPHVVEQQAYFREQDGRVTYMRVVCSGFRPRS